MFRATVTGRGDQNTTTGTRKISKEPHRCRKVGKVSEEDIKRRHRGAVRELNGHKEKHLKIKAHCTSLMRKLEEKIQELVQKE